MDIMLSSSLAIVVFYTCIPTKFTCRVTSPTFDQSEAEKLYHTNSLTQNQHTVRPCSPTSACKNAKMKLTFFKRKKRLMFFLEKQEFFWTASWIKKTTALFCPIQHGVRWSHVEGSFWGSIETKFYDINHELFCWRLILVKLQAKSLGVDFVLPLSQEQEQEEQEPTPKFIRSGRTRRLKFGTKTTHGLLAEFRGLGVRRTHVTRRTRRTPPKSAISDNTKNIIVTHRRCLPIFFLSNSRLSL